MAGNVLVEVREVRLGAEAECRHQLVGIVIEENIRNCSERDLVLVRLYWIHVVQRAGGGRRPVGACEVYGRNQVQLQPTSQVVDELRLLNKRDVL